MPGFPGTTPSLPELAAVLDTLDEGVVVRDANDALLLCNRAAEVLTGLRLEHLTRFPDLPPGWTALEEGGEPMAPGTNASARCLRTGQPVHALLTGIRNPDGAVTWLAVNARPLPGGGVIVTFTDVTESRRLADEGARLRARLERVNALRLAAAPAIVGAADDLQLLQRTCEIAVRDAGFLLAWVGVPDHDAGVVRPVASSGDTDYLAGVVVALDDEDARSHGPTGTAVRTGCVAVNRASATDPWLKPWRERALAHGFGSSASFPLPWNGEHGALTVYAAEPDFFNDDEVRMLEQFADDLANGLRQAASRRLLTTLTANMGEGLLALDAGGRLTFANDTARELLGWTVGVADDVPVHDLLHPAWLRGDACDPATCPIIGALATGEAARREDDFARADGTVLPVSCTATALDPGAASGAIVVFSDATQRRREARRLQEELERVTWLARIRAALAEDRFVLHAQPIVEVATGRAVQHELLLRMRDEDGVLVPPGDFLPEAEASGIVGEIDRWVVEQAIALARRGHHVEFNLSAASLTDPSIVAFIERLVTEEALPPGRLVCEVTETAFVTDHDAGEEFLTSLERLGIDVALDDFGSGYGAFSYLKAFPARYLKIDQEFVCDLDRHPASRHVVEAIVQLAHRFGKRTVAEGVENPALLPLLAELGVDFAQGFGIARPAPLDEILGPDTTI